MNHLFRLLFVAFVVTLFTSFVAFAQDGALFPVPIPVDGGGALGNPGWLTLVLAAIIPTANFLNTFISSRVPFVGKIITAFAMAWGKASVDDKKQ